MYGEISSLWAIRWVACPLRMSSATCCLRTFSAAVGGGDPVRWAAMFTDDATYATPDLPNPLRGRDALEAMAATFFKAFPDMAFEVRSVIEQDNVVVWKVRPRAPSLAR